MRRRNTIILAVLLALLGAYVYFFELSKGEKGKSEKLVNFKSDEAAAVALGYPGREIQLQREPSGRWKLTQPLQAAADDAAVASLLAALSASEIKRTLEKKPEAENLKSYGLSPPAVKVSITLRNGLTLPTLMVGAKTPLGDSAYVQRAADPGVYLTGASLAFALEKEPEEFRDKTVFPLPQEQVTRVEILTPGQSLLLAKGEKEQWTIEAPIKKNANAEAVADYLAALGRLRAKAFVDDQPADVKKYGLDRAAIKISLGGMDGKTLAALEIGSKSGDAYYARREGSSTVYAIDASSYNLLQRRPDNFIAEEKPEQKK